MGDSVPVRAEGLLAVDGLVVNGRAVVGSVEVRVTADLVCRVPAEGGTRDERAAPGVDVQETPPPSVDGVEEDGERARTRRQPLRLDSRVELELRPATGGSTVLEATVYVGAGGRACPP